MGRPKQRSDPPDSGDRAERLQAELEQAQDVLRELISGSDDSIGQARSRALQEGRVWSLQALLCQSVGDIEAAAKAATASARAGELAARLERDTIADRVAELERRMNESKRAGSRLRALAEKVKA